jgi:hypothetical protein
MDGTDMPDISSLTSEIQNLEGWSSFWAKTGLVLGALTAAFGVFSAFAAGASYWYGVRLKPMQDELTRVKDEQLARDLKDKDEQIAAMKKATAEAELQLAVVRKTQLARVFSFDFQKFQEALKGKPTGTAVFLYPKDDSEALEFARRLSWMLKDVGWNVDPMPKPVPSVREVVKGHALTNARFSGVYVLANNSAGFPPSDTVTADGALINAFLAEGSGAGCFIDKTLPDNVFRVVVGPKP